ncbi:hypothetical protein E2C01_003989 [Portunus trituberculatus]|uniref:Uncharacterized protein n=1 Tax=Portunus trituberculatus TaxID=210409 RepID=A0A5B7CQ59_PORTR|nr:hypothetical protein [Portunus trituberculatus]
MSPLHPPPARTSSTRKDRESAVLWLVPLETVSSPRPRSHVLLQSVWKRLVMTSEIKIRHGTLPSP